MNNLQKISLIILILVGIIIAIGAVGYVAFYPKIISDTTTINNKNNIYKACSQEAKLCPDGSYVSRTGPNCEFTACPQPKQPNSNQVTLKAGQKEGPLLVQAIYPTYVTGLSYREYPVAMLNGQPITLYIGQAVSNGCNFTLTLVSINGSSAIFTEKISTTKNCPI